MTYLQFVASMTGSMAWPIFVLAVAISFRKHIAKLIVSVSKISHGETEVLFDQKAKEVQAAMAVSDLRVSLGRRLTLLQISVR